MQRYKEFQPTGFDAKGLNADEYDIGNFLVLPCAQNRDSDVLACSNFEVALRMLGGESETVQVHRFGHWANGWFEIILVAPDSPQATIAETIEAHLDDYPILDEIHFSDLEFIEVCEYWARMSVSERVDYCQRARISVFAARRDELPADDDGRLFELLTRNL